MNPRMIETRIAMRMPELVEILTRCDQRNETCKLESTNCSEFNVSVDPLRPITNSKSRSYLRMNRITYTRVGRRPRQPADYTADFDVGKGAASGL